MYLTAFLLAAAVTSQVSATCIFSVELNAEYRCTLEGVTAWSSYDLIDLTGTHIGGRTNADVVHLRTATSTTLEEIPTIIFLTFRNLRILTTSPRLMRLNLDFGTDLTHLHLSGNQLMFQLNAGALRGCKSLDSLDLSHSSMQAIDDNAFDDTANLTRIVMIGNFLPMVRSGWTRALPNLNFLQLMRNQITSIQSGALVGSSVRDLWLSENRLTRIESGTFTNMPNLVFLRLEDNLITTIEAGALSNLPQLTILQLARNQITTLHDIFATPLPILYEMRIENNRINAVARNFFDGTPRGQYFYFTNNVCVSGNGLFIVETSIEVDVLPGMQTCFDNYV